MVLVTAARARPDRRRPRAPRRRRCDALARAHLATPMLARTLMQPAQVISFGFKIVAWLAPLVRARERLARARRGGAAAAVRRRRRHARVARRQGPGGGARGSPRSSASRPATAPGTSSATTGSRSAARSPCCAARSARSAATSRCSRRPRSARSPSRRAPAAAARRRCRRRRIRSRRWPRSPPRCARRITPRRCSRRWPQAHERGLGDWQAELAEWPSLFLAAHGALRRPRRRLRRARGRRRAHARQHRAPARHGVRGSRRRAARAVARQGEGARVAGDAVGAQRSREGARPAGAVARRSRRRAPSTPAALDAAFDVDAAARRAGALAAAQLDRLAHSSLPAGTAHDRPTQPPERSDDFDRGVANRRAVLGDEWVDQLARRRERVQRRLPEPDHALRLARDLGPARPRPRDPAPARPRHDDGHGALGGIRAALPRRDPRRRADREDQGDAAAGRDLLRRAGGQHRLQDRRRDPARRRARAGAAIARRRRASRRTTPSARRSCASPCRAGPGASSSATRSASTCTCGTRSRRAWRRDHTVLRYDQRGHGESARPPGPYAMDELVDDAARLIREWGRGPVAWVGLSMGGMVGQGLAIRHPELLRGVVLANTVARYPEAARATWTAAHRGGRAGRHGRGRRRRRRALSPRRLSRRASRGGRRAAPRLLRTIRRATSPRATRSPASTGSIGSATVRLPTLVLAGARDAGATPEMAKAIAERIPGAELRVFADASHLSVVEAARNSSARYRRSSPRCRRADARRHIHGHRHEQSIRLPSRPRRQEGHLHPALRQRLRVHRRGRSEHRRRHRRRRGDGDRHPGHAGDGRGRDPPHPRGDRQADQVRRDEPLPRGARARRERATARAR